MSIINISRKESQLELKIDHNFNLRAKNMINTRLAPEISALSIDLSNCRIVDSEAVIFMYKWLQAGNELHLNSPPKILFEILDVLEIRDEWNQLSTN